MFVRQPTTRRARLEQKAMPPSGRYVGSMSWNGALGVSCVSPLPSALISQSQCFLQQRPGDGDGARRHGSPFLARIRQGCADISAITTRKYPLDCLLLTAWLSRISRVTHRVAVERSRCPRRAARRKLPVGRICNPAWTV